jgi:hypothetical protein
VNVLFDGLSLRTHVYRTLPGASLDIRPAKCTRVRGQGPVISGEPEIATLMANAAVSNILIEV